MFEYLYVTVVTFSIHVLSDKHQTVLKSKQLQ